MISTTTLGVVLPARLMVNLQTGFKVRLKTLKAHEIWHDCHNLDRTKPAMKPKFND